MTLNPQQLEAVHHTKGPLLILAGAGSGKTGVITHRIAHLIKEKKVGPWNILAVTFTNKAADEMKHRVRGLLGGRGQEIWISTFHATCVRILRKSLPGIQGQFVIYDDSDSMSLIKEAMEELKMEERAFPARSVSTRIQSAKNEVISPAAYAAAASDFMETRVAEIYTLYQKKLEQNNALDFGDLIAKTVTLFRQSPPVLKTYQDLWHTILIDEYQDTNRAQYLLTRLLSETHKNICVVGDEDQCLIGNTRISMANGSLRPIKQVRVGDEVISCYGSGDFRPARIIRVFRKHRQGEGISILLQSGRKLVSTPEHIHFSGYRLGMVPQVYFTYLMYKRGIGWRLGTTQVYTEGQKKPMVGFAQRLMQEHADALWIVGTHTSENEARAEEYILSLKYQLPTLPFVPRKGKGQRGLVHDFHYLSRVFKSFDTDSSARCLLVDRGLSFDYPHHRPRSRNSKRRNVIVTLCGDKRGRTPMHRISIAGNDMDGQKKLKKLGFSVRPTKKGSLSWRFETANKDFGSINQILKDIQKVFDVNVFFTARFGANSKKKIESNSLPFLPAASIMPGMVMFTDKGGYDIVKKVNRIVLDKDVYDLNVEATHNFVANGIVTHNSIYRWRGADIQNILNFEADYPGCKVIRLEQNYRSTQNILTLANSVISKNLARKGKKLWTSNPEGERVVVYQARDERDEARFVVNEVLRLKESQKLTYNDFAIFYRTNVQSRTFEEELRKSRVPYTIFGGVRFYDRKEIKDLIAYLRVLVNPQDSLNLKRILNVPPRGLGAKAVEHLENFASEHNTTLLEAVLRLEEIPNMPAMARSRVAAFGRMMESFKKFMNENSGVAALLKKIMEESGYLEMLQKEKTLEAEGRVENMQELLNVADEFEKTNETPTPALFLDQLALVGQTDNYDPDQGVLPMMTLHLAKGLEFPVIFLVGLEEGLFPHSRSLDEPEEMEEERRLCYVGLTRGRQRVFLTHALRRHLYGGDQFNPPSRFLEEMPEELIEKKECSGVIHHALSTMNGAPTDSYDDFDQRSDDEIEENFLKIGTTVQHPAFGVGVVKRREGSGEAEKVTVYFNNGQIKTLVTRFANLSVV